MAVLVAVLCASAVSAEMVGPLRAVDVYYVGAVAEGQTDDTACALIDCVIPPACAAVVISMHVELTVILHPGESVALRAMNGSHVAEAVARDGPAQLEMDVLQGDSCPDVSVAGLTVDARAPYVLRVAYLTEGA